MRALLVLSALVALALASGKSDIYIAVDHDVSPTVYFYHNDYEHYIYWGSESGSQDVAPYTNPGYSYRETGSWESHTPSWTWDDPTSSVCVGTMRYKFFDDLPLTPGTVLGFHVPVTAGGEYAEFSYWVRTEWFQSLYSRSCWYSNQADCNTERQVVMCKNDNSWSDDANWLLPSFKPELHGFYYPEEIATHSTCTSEKFYRMPRNSFWLRASAANTGMHCRLVIPDPAFSDMTMEKGGCTGTTIDTATLVHPVTETLYMSDYLTIYPPIHFTYYNELVRAMTIFPMGAVQFNDWWWNIDHVDTDGYGSGWGEYTYFPDGYVDETYGEGYDFIVDQAQVNFTHPQYHGDIPRWVEWPSWYNLPHALVADDPYYYRSCQLSMWADNLEYRYDTNGDEMVTVTYGLKQGSPNVFVIQISDIPYTSACTPIGKGVTLQLQIYEDTSDVSRMEIHYVQTDKPVERFQLPQVVDGPVTAFDPNDYYYWYTTWQRANYQMPNIGMTSCDLVWGGKLQDYFPGDGECVSIVGCRNGYHDATTGACACADRFTTSNPSSNLVARCQPCGAQSYKYTVGDDVCSKCPEYSIMADNIYGMDDNSECECIALYGGDAAEPGLMYAENYDPFNPHPDHLPCEQCAGTKAEKKFVGNRDCDCSFSQDYPAPVNPTVNYAGDGTDIDVDGIGYGLCECGCGTYGHGYRYWSETTGTPATQKNYYASCELCPANTFKATTGNVASGTAGSGDATGGCESCLLDIHGATASTPALLGQCVCTCVTYGGSWIAANETCLCDRAHYMTGAPGSRSCNSICGVNPNTNPSLYKDVSGNEQTLCTQCPPDSSIPITNVNDYDHDQYSDCGCNTNYGVFLSPDSNKMQCYRCMGDLWVNTSRPLWQKIQDNPVCQCEDHATAYLDTSVTPYVIRCGCNPEYEYIKAGWGNCQLCANTMYKSWYNTMTEARKCQPCTGIATTYNPGWPTNDGTGALHCFCPLGWFRSSDSACTVCAYGSILSQFCTTAMYQNASGVADKLHDVDECTPCPNSGTTYASPSTGTTVATGYPYEWVMTTLGATTGANYAYWHDEDSDCFCPAGWYRVGSDGHCGDDYSCTECLEDEYRDVSTTTLHKLDYQPGNCYDCPTSVLTVGTSDMQSSFRQKSAASCYCQDGEWYNASAYTAGLVDHACHTCPSGTFQPHYNKEAKTVSCQSCTGIYDDSGSCITYTPTLGWPYYPHWAGDNTWGRAMYLRPQITHTTEYAWLNTLISQPTAWLPVPGSELIFDTNSYSWSYSEMDGFYYDFMLDFEFLTSFRELSHSLRLYLGGYEGIFLMPGHEQHGLDSVWKIWPYDCDNRQSWTNDDFWYDVNTPGGTNIFASWYLWDPADVVLSVAQTGSVGSRKFVIQLSGYHRIHDVYTDGTSDRMSIFFIVYEDTTVHAIDLYVDNAPHLCDIDAQTTTNGYDPAEYQCYLRFDYNNGGDIDTVQTDYWGMSTQKPWYVYENFYIRFDFAWCQRCTCHATNSYYQIYPENWDKNGCACGCDIFKSNATATTGICDSCKAGFSVDHYGACQSVQIGTNPTRKVTTAHSCGYHCIDLDTTDEMDYANDCKCYCGYKYNITQGGTCWECPVDTYSTGTEVCIPCPLHSTTGLSTGQCGIEKCVCDSTLHYAAVPQLVGTAYQCMCDYGYTFSGTTCVACNAGYEKKFISKVVADNQCTKCDYGYYKTNVGPNYCSACGDNGYSGWITKTNGNTDTTPCTCDYGYQYSGTSSFPDDATDCYCCGLSSYKPNQTLAQGCIDCKDNAQFDWYCASRNECGCDQNYGLDTLGNCKHCNTSLSIPQYKMYRGQAQCSKCASNQYEILTDDPYINPTFELDDWANPDQWAPLTTGINTAVTQSFAYVGGFCSGLADWFKKVRLFPTSATTPIPIPGAEGTFKGLANFRDVNVYVRGQHTILFSIEEDGFDMCHNYPTNNGNPYDWYYDFGIQFGYRIDVETLRIRSSTSTTAATIEVSFDFEGVYGSSVNKSNIVQFVLNKAVDASSGVLDNQKIWLVVGQVSDITVPVVAYFGNWFQSEELYVPDTYEECVDQFHKNTDIDESAGDNYWPLCKMPTSMYIDTVRAENPSQRWRYVAQFTQDPCTPKPPTPKTCTAPQILYSDGQCHTCPTCTVPSGGVTCAADPTYYAAGFVWQTGVFSATGDTACACPAGTFFSPVNNDCEACDTQYRLGPASRATSCVNCPVGSYFETALGQYGAADLSRCICNQTFTHIAHMAGDQDPTNAATWCRGCPPASRRRNEDGREMINQCICDEWFASIPNQFAADGVTPSDFVIPDNEWQCMCDPGYYGVAGNPKNYPDASPSLICLPCPINYYTDNTWANDATFSSRCRRCANGLSPYDATWGKELCYCPAGQGGFPNSVTDERACETCVGGSKTFDGNALCSCVVDLAIADPGVCKCPPGYGGDARGVVVNVTQECVLCPADTYKAALANADCTPCPFGAGTFNGTTGATNVSKCECRANYYGLAANGTNCTYCHLGSKPAGDNIACTCSTGSGVVSGNDGLCYCSPGYYFVYLTETCAACPADTYSTIDNLDNACTACPLHTTTSGSPLPWNSVSDCVCAAGYEPNGGSCTACPANYHKYNPGNFACEAGIASSQQSSHGGNSGSGHHNGVAAVAPSAVVLALMGLLLFLLKL